MVCAATLPAASPRRLGGFRGGPAGRRRGCRSRAEPLGNLEEIYDRFEQSSSVPEVHRVSGGTCAWSAADWGFLGRLADRLSPTSSRRAAAASRSGPRHRTARPPPRRDPPANGSSNRSSQQIRARRDLRPGPGRPPARRDPATFNPGRRSDSSSTASSSSTPATSPRWPGRRTAAGSLIFWAIDYFKSAQAERSPRPAGRCRRSTSPACRRDWPLSPQFTEAMDQLDVEKADAATAGLVRSLKPQEIFHQFARYAARDFRSIGHKAIFLANAWQDARSHRPGPCRADPPLARLRHALPRQRAEPRPERPPRQTARGGRTPASRGGDGGMAGPRRRRRRPAT